MPDFKKIFENSIVKLCENIDCDGVKKLDTILTQEKSDKNILTDIITSFPLFKNIFLDELRKGNYATTS